MPAAPMGQAAQMGGGPSPAGSSVSMPSQSQGSQVNGIAKVRQAIKLLESAVSEVGAEGDLGQEILKSLKGLSAKAPQSETTAGAEGTALQALAAKAKQSAPLLALARAQGGAQGQPGGGEAPQPPQGM